MATTEARGEYRDISICCVPYRMTIVEGGVVFSNRSGFYGVTGRFMFAYRSHLWYLDHSQSTWGDVAACHLVRMHERLSEYIGPDHAEADGTEFKLTFKK